MASGTGRWLAPLGASAAVLAVFVVPGMVASSGTSTGGVGPDQPEPVLTPHDPVTPALPPDGAEERSPDPRHVDLIGYRADGRDLLVFYTVDQTAGCSGAIEEPMVEERVGSVLIWVRRQRTADSDEVCVNRIPTSSVEVRLNRPLGGRLLQDRSRGGSLVPPLASQP
jgi:hypothetical protein